MKNSTCKIGIVVSEFNAFVTSQLESGCMDFLISQGVSKDNITLIKVPGAVEIPLVLQLLAKAGDYAALIALGAVIQGETSHYDYVCDQVNQGCLRVMLDYSIPVIFGVLTTENDAQALDRTGGVHGHKGKDAAETALAMISIISQI